MESATPPASRVPTRNGTPERQTICHGAAAGKSAMVSSIFKGEKKEAGHFVLGETLGEGTFGEVKLAMHKPTSERVAAKASNADYSYQGVEERVYSMFITQGV